MDKTEQGKYFWNNCLSLIVENGTNLFYWSGMCATVRHFKAKQGNPVKRHTVKSAVMDILDYSIPDMVFDIINLQKEENIKGRYK